MTRHKPELSFLKRLAVALRRWDTGVMKTTLEIPAPTFRRANAAAGLLGIPLREYVTQAVEEKLSLGIQRPGKPWLECAGELAHLHKETKRIQQIIDEEFEQIEPQDWA